ncbi:hypothetical protein [Phytobacter sp. V91]|uniref:hypothetical protein n=1 Tax=Phytobacter sp. V91 TaxID=3369425 RepID=UPI003F63E975
MCSKNVYDGENPDTEIFDISQWPMVFIRFPQLNMPDRTQRLLPNQFPQNLVESVFNGIRQQCRRLAE